MVYRGAELMHDISFEEALDLVRKHICSLSPEIYEQATCRYLGPQEGPTPPQRSKQPLLGGATPRELSLSLSLGVLLDNSPGG